MALELLNQRISIYNILSEWITNAKIICRNDMHFNQSLPLLRAMIFNNAKDVELENLKSQRTQLEQEMMKGGITKERKKILQEQLNALSTNLVLRKFSMMGQEEKVIELAEICFDTDFSTIKKFVDAYMKMALNIENEMVNDKEWPYANQLKDATQKIIDAGILEKMKSEMKDAKSLSKHA